MIDKVQVSDKDVKNLISNLKKGVVSFQNLTLDVLIENGKIMNDKWAPYFEEKCSHRVADKEDCNKESSTDCDKVL